MRPPGRAARVPEGALTPSPTTATASASSAPPVGSPLSPPSKEASVPRHQLQEGHRQVRSIATVATREYFGIWSLIGFTEKTSFWPRLLVGYITANGWLATASHIPWKKVKVYGKTR